jgi:hypothetical protein
VLVRELHAGVLSVGGVPANGSGITACRDS